VEAEAKRRANRGRPGAPVPKTGTAVSAVPGVKAAAKVAGAPAADGPIDARGPAKPSTGSKPKLSKDAYRRRRETLDAELGRLGLRKTQLDLAMGTPSVAANFVEMRRVTSELADVDRALAAAEDAWLELEEMAP
jgi:hypothetical protein